MKNYIKYLILFIVLIGIGILGINLYSKENLKQVESNNTLAQKTEKEETKTEETTKEEEKEIELDTNSETVTNTTSETTETSKGYINENSTTNQATSTIINPTDLTVSSSTSNTETKEETNASTNNTTTNATTNNNNSSVASISEEENTNSFHILEIDPNVYSTTSSTNTTTKTTTSTSANNSTNSNNTTTEENVITVTTEEQKVTTSSSTQNNTNTSTQNNNTTTSSNSTTQNNTTQSTTTTSSSTTTNNLSNLETATSYQKIKILKSLTSKDLTKKVSVVGNNGSGIAQSFCVAGNNYITAQINSNNTRTLIQVYDKTTGKKKNSIVSNFYHANGMTYNKNTNSIYLVHANNNKYSIFSNKNIETASKLSVTTKAFPKSISGIAYDESTDQYCAAKGNYVYIYDNNFKLIRTIKKLRAETPQDIGAYKGIILVIVYQPNNTTANNAIDLYRASDGAYLGTYNLKFSNMELESIDYSGTDNIFSLYFNSLGKSTDYIYTTKALNLK